METAMSWGAEERQGAGPGQVRAEEEVGFAETAVTPRGENLSEDPGGGRLALESRLS